MLKFLTAGESHGPALTAIVEGLPAGLAVDPAAIAGELSRRRIGFGRGRRMAIEQDRFEIVGGVRFGRTLGGPVAVIIHNTEWPKWEQEMSPLAGESRKARTTPRPGHADLPGMLKYDTKDARDILERSSARETAARAVVGTLAATLLEAIGVSVLSHVVEIGGVGVEPGSVPGPADRDRIDRSPVRCFDGEAERRMVEAIEAAASERDTVGGVVEVLVFGLPAGIGSHVHWDRKLDARLAAAVVSIPAIKAVEFGDGMESSRRPGSVAHDEIVYGTGGFGRTSDRAGGIEGGMSTGQTLRLRAAMKPISTLMRPLRTVDVETKDAHVAFRERSDVCAVPAAGVVAEHMVAFVVADEVLRKFGGDTVADLVEAVEAYRRRLARY